MHLVPIESIPNAFSDLVPECTSRLVFAYLVRFGFWISLPIGFAFFFAAGFRNDRLAAFLYLLSGVRQRFQVFVLVGPSISSSHLPYMFRKVFCIYLPIRFPNTSRLDFRIPRPIRFSNLSPDWAAYFLSRRVFQMYLAPGPPMFFSGESSESFS